MKRNGSVSAPSSGAQRAALALLLGAPLAAFAQSVLPDYAWIGAKSTVLKGVTIGRGAIVAASSVVTRSVAPFTVVAGNPARAVREIKKEGSTAEIGSDNEVAG